MRDLAAVLLPYDQLAEAFLNPRTSFDDAPLRELAESIAAQGLLQPIVVARPASPDATGFAIVAGARRYRAIGLLIRDGRWPANRPVPCRQVEAEAGDLVLARAVVENAQRVDLDPLEEADAFARLVDYDPQKWTTAAIARAIGKSQRHVQQRLSLRERLPAEEKAALTAGTLTVRTALTKLQPAKPGRGVAKAKKEKPAKVEPRGSHHYIDTHIGFIAAAIKRADADRQPALWQHAMGQLRIHARLDDTVKSPSPLRGEGGVGVTAPPPAIINRAPDPGAQMAALTAATKPATPGLAMAVTIETDMPPPSSRRDEDFPPVPDFLQRNKETP